MLAPFLDEGMKSTITSKLGANKIASVHCSLSLTEIFSSSRFIVVQLRPMIYSNLSSRNSHALRHWTTSAANEAELNLVHQATNHPWHALLSVNP